MRFVILSLLIVLLAGSCKSKQTLKEKQSELSAGKLDEKNMYTSTEVGWTVQLPENWEVQTKKENDRINEKGKKIIEESSGIKVDNSGLIQLINLRKNTFNSFISTIEPFVEKKDGSYEQHNVAILNMMKRAYESKKIHAEYDAEKESINGLEFDVVACKIYAPNGKGVVLYQRMYSRLINGYDFAMTIIYNNDDDKRALMDVINSSKFTIRN